MPFQNPIPLHVRCLGEIKDTRVMPKPYKGNKQQTNSQQHISKVLYKLSCSSSPSMNFFTVCCFVSFFFFFFKLNGLGWIS